MGRKRPAKHTVHTRHPRYTVPRYDRGQGTQAPILRSTAYRVSPEVYPLIKKEIIANYPKGQEYPELAGIAIFGSQAYGSPKPNSDIDVLVVVNTTERFHGDILTVDPHIRRAEKRLSQDLGRKVEITSMPRQSTWEDFLTRRNGMTKQELVKKSVWLYDKKGISTSYNR